MAASQSGVFNAQQFTDAGLPAASYRLYTYTQGTTTHKAAYTDAAGVVPHTYTSDGAGGSYIALNARGELPAPLFLTSGAYDLALKTPSGATVWTRYAAGTADSAATLAADFASAASASKGSGMIGYDRALAYAAATVGRKLQQLPNVADFGAALDGTTDDTAAWQAAAAVGGLIFMPAGKTSLITDTITAGSVRTVFIGAGPYISTIKFNPATARPCFYFTAGASSVVQSGVIGFGFTSDNSIDKTAIKIRDGRHCVVSDIGISQGAWLGSGSIGLHTQGRDTLSAARFSVICARPIFIDVNPAYATLHCDHFQFEDMEVGSTLAAGKCIEIADGVNISNLAFTGYQAWLLGKYGLYWNDTTSTVNGAGLLISGMRTEQASAATGYSVYLASTAQPLKAISIANSYFDAGRNGVYVRRGHTISIEDSFLEGGAGRTNLDITFESATELNLRNTFSNVGATVTLTGAVAMAEMPWAAAARSCTATGFWRYGEGSLPSQRSARQDGVLGFRWKGTVADVAQINLPVLTGGGALVAAWRVSVVGATKHEAATGSWKSGAVVLLANTAGVVTVSTGGKLAVIDSGTGLAVVNRLGESVTMVVDVTWAD